MTIVCVCLYVPILVSLFGMHTRAITCVVKVKMFSPILETPEGAEDSKNSSVAEASVHTSVLLRMCVRRGRYRPDMSTEKFLCLLPRPSSSIQSKWGPDSRACCKSVSCWASQHIQFYVCLKLPSWLQSLSKLSASPFSHFLKFLFFPSN